MRILRPRVAGVRFAGHAAEPGIGQHVRPWRRRRLSLRQVDHVLVAVRGERAEAVAFAQRRGGWIERPRRSEEHTSELQSLMRTSYAVFCLKQKKNTTTET